MMDHEAISSNLKSVCLPCPISEFECTFGLFRKKAFLTLHTHFTVWYKYPYMCILNKCLSFSTVCWLRAAIILMSLSSYLFRKESAGSYKSGVFAVIWCTSQPFTIWSHLLCIKQTMSMYLVIVSYTSDCRRTHSERETLLGVLFFSLFWMFFKFQCFIYI